MLTRKSTVPLTPMGALPKPHSTETYVVVTERDSDSKSPIETKMGSEKKDPSFSPEKLSPSGGVASPQTIKELQVAVPKLGTYLFGSAKKRFPISLGTVVTLSSNASGYVNSVVAVSTVAALAEFTSLATIFDEFFVRRMHLHYVPRSQYQGNLTWAAGTEESNVAMGLINLHHGATTYTSIAAAANNLTYKHMTTGRPWSYEWVNVESINSEVVVAAETSSPVASQGWALTASAPSALYTGQTQLISPSAGTILVASKVLGDIFVKFDVVFRSRA